MESLINTTFIILLITTGIVSTFLGVLMEWQKQKPGGLAIMMTILGTFIVTFWTQGQFTLELVFGQFLIWSGLIGLGCILRSKSLKEGLHIALLIWLSMGLGWLIGTLNILGASLFLVAICILLFIPRWIASYERQQQYYLEISVQTPQVLPRLNQLFNAFEIRLDGKKVIRDDWLTLQVSFKALPLVHHLIMKRLFEVDEIEKVVSV